MGKISVHFCKCSEQTEQPLVKPYIMLNKNGLKIAVVGKVVFENPIQRADM